MNREEGHFSLRKTDKDTPGARKIQTVGSRLGTVIPKCMARDEGIKRGTYLFLAFEWDGTNKTLWLEAGGKMRDIVRISETGETEGSSLRFYLHESIRGGLNIGNELIMEAKDGKLYMRKKQ